MVALQRELPVGDPSVVPLGRSLVAQWLPPSTPHDAVADTELAVSELLANAVASAHGCIRIEVSLMANRVRLSVYDDGPGEPRISAATTRATSGRGLAIVEVIAAAWGVRADPPGKWVWADVDLAVA